MKKALVTGGAGFIGSHLARRLLREGWDVWIIDNLSTGFMSNVPEKAVFIKADLSRDDFISRLPRERLDAVFHLAAQSSGEISFDDPVYDIRTNTLSTLMLLDWAHKNGARHFVYTSSMSIYGDQAAQPVAESAPAKPKSFYGVGKLASESYLAIYAGLGLNTTSLRLFNVYGPGQNMENLRQGMVSIYMAYIAKGEDIPVKGSADRYRDFVYIDDVVEAYMSCLFNPRSYGGIYNIGTGIKTTVGGLIRMELEAFGRDPASYPVKFSGSTAGDTFGIYADTGRIRTDIGWQPEVTLTDGLRRMAEWVHENSTRASAGSQTVG